MFTHIYVVIWCHVLFVQKCPYEYSLLVLYLCLLYHQLSNNTVSYIFITIRFVVSPYEHGSLISPECRIYALVNWVSIRRQAIIQTDAILLSIGPLGTKFSETIIKIHNFSFWKMHRKISSSNWRLFCPRGYEAEIKWPPFIRGHFQMHFLEWNCMNFDWNFTDVCS